MINHIRLIIPTLCIRLIISSGVYMQHTKAQDFLKHLAMDDLGEGAVVAIIVSAVILSKQIRKKT